ncbi:MAG: hypothetical protein K2X77_30760 [Candidatus Obscuribacterales bacterium]|nr:hypothetical protein [Candidatus Obscuribacterales bacterium]
MKTDTTSKWKQIGGTIVQCLSALSIVVALPTVASAYSADLVRSDFPDLERSSASTFGFGGMFRRPSAPVLLTDKNQTKKLHTAPSSHSFITRTLIKTSKENSSLLWSMYPASVRGRAFGATGGNPISSGGW